MTWCRHVLSDHWRPEFCSPEPDSTRHQVDHALTVAEQYASRPLFLFVNVSATHVPHGHYINHPHRIGDAEFNPSGLAAAVEAGFLVPPTLITSDPDAARAFVKRHGSVIYKPLHNPVYRVDGVSNVVKVDEVSAVDIDDGVAGTAHLFQRRIVKSADVRVTVIGDQVYCVRIDSDLLDWRTDYDRLTYTPVEPPPGIVPALRHYMDHFGLVFGAFDFCVAEDGPWWFLECNPSGQWYWLEPETGLPLCAALADLLERKTTT